MTTTTDEIFRLCEEVFADDGPVVAASTAQDGTYRTHSGSQYTVSRDGRVVDRVGPAGAGLPSGASQHLGIGAYLVEVEGGEHYLMLVNRPGENLECGLVTSAVTGFAGS
jgi:hypothetical protein